MSRIAMTIVLLCSLLFAETTPKDMTVGIWVCKNSYNNNHTDVTETETLALNADHTFSDTIVVDLVRGKHFVKGLQVKAEGIWKRYLTTLVVVIKKIDVPFAKEVSDSISYPSLQALASTYQARFNRSPILFFTITFLDNRKLVVKSEQGNVTEYLKALPPPPGSKPKRKRLHDKPINLQ